jgi:transposase
MRRRYLTGRPRFTCWRPKGSRSGWSTPRTPEHLPGRPKTDRLDAVWLCKLAERQLLRPSFVPPPPTASCGTWPATGPTWWRRGPPRTTAWSRLLEDAQIKLSVVASDIFGASGRDMLAALIAGTRDPKALAQLARGRMRAKRGVLEEAFCGHFSDHHGFLLAKMLARVDLLDRDIAELDRKLEELIAPFAHAVQRLDEVSGVGRIAAWVIISEVGVDMGRFATAGHLASWAKFTPGVKESAGKKKGKASTGHGNPYLARVLGEAAVAAGKTDTFLRGALPAHRPPPRHQTGHRRGRTFHPGDRLAAAG